MLIPIRRDHDLSDGELHSTDAWSWIDDPLFVQFEGGTMAPGLYTGFYRDPDTGSRVDDSSRKFIVALPRRRLRELRALLESACGVFQQKCIYLSIGGNVEFIAPTAR
ncbi:MAG: hypothetical protein AB7U20_06460 [Planctomycetaceae bacterium]